MTSHQINRRNFLIASTAVTAAVFSNPLSLAAAGLPASGQRRLELNGHWQLARSGADDWIPATVPGCVHTDLLAAGKIPDPFFRDNEKLLQWIGETNWTIRRTFDVP
jgi:beta-galactosidase/beta-glucuronidase